MTFYPDPSAMILVAVMPHPRDFEIARMLGWYRIPLRSAPKVIEVDYLVFYQTGAFGEAHRWRIETFAEVRGHEMMRRRDLFRDQPDHPRANEEYYKIQLGPLQSLPRPIGATRWRRVTFLYTTGALLQKAETLNDLVVRSDERDILWKSLRERAMQADKYAHVELPEFPVDPLLLAMLGDWGQLDQGYQQPSDG